VDFWVSDLVVVVLLERFFAKRTCTGFWELVPVIGKISCVPELRASSSRLATRKYGVWL